jgi:two-component system LytT family response regulator
VRVLIVDDEPIARQRIRRLLRAVADAELAGECGTVRAAIDALARQDVDVVLLDVQLPDGTGFDVLHGLPDEPPVIVFVTAYDEHALRAFDVHAVDYLLKPFDARRFRVAVDRARERLQSRASGADDAGLEALAAWSGGPEGREPGRYAKRLMIRSSGRLYFLRTADIDWIEAARNYARIHVGTDVHVTRRALGTLERILDPEEFVRIHRSTIVNVNRIREMQPWFSRDYIVILESGTRLRLTRNHRGLLQAAGPRKP